MEQSLIMREAMQYVREHNFSIIPIREGEKKPAVKWKKYQEKKASEEQAEAWFGSGQHNIGIVTGPVSGLLVLDVDGEEGRESLGDLTLPPTPTVSTPNGTHYYYSWPDGANISIGAGLMDHVDWRGHGGYVVAPPSSTDDGSYEWLEFLNIEDTPLADPPQWMLDRITDDAMQDDTVANLSVEIPSDIEKQYEMFAEIATTDGAQNWRSILRRGVGKGQRNDMCLRLASYMLSGADLKERLAWKFIQVWNKKNNPPMGPEELRETFKNALDYHEQDVLEGVAKQYEEKKEGTLDIFSWFDDIQRVEIEPDEFVWRFKFCDGVRCVEPRQVEITPDQLSTKYRFERKLAEQTGVFLGGDSSSLDTEKHRKIFNFFWENCERVSELEVSEFEALAYVVVEKLRNTGTEALENVLAEGMIETSGERIFKHNIIHKQGKYLVHLPTLYEQVMVKRPDLDPSQHRIARVLRAVGFDESRGFRLGDMRKKLWSYSGTWPPVPPSEEDLTEMSLQEV